MSDERYYKRTIIKETIDSAVLHEVRTLRVYLPPGYDERLTYPVVYCQDGEQFFNFGRIATTATRLILDDGVEPFVIVGVDVNADKRTDDYAPEGGRHKDYKRFFVEEMLRHIESKYPVRTTPDERILAGDSLGATVSLHLALDHRDLFRNILSLSGAFLSLTEQTLSAESNLAWLRIYQLIGTDETSVVTNRGTFDFLNANRRVRELLTERSAELLYVEKPGKHLWGFWQKELADGLKWFLSAT
jgi:enterochelin esterase-like enzyme